MTENAVQAGLTGGAGPAICHTSLRSSRGRFVLDLTSDLRLSPVQVAANPECSGAGLAGLGLSWVKPVSPIPSKREPILLSADSAGEMASLSDASASVMTAHPARERARPLELATVFRRYAPYVARIGLRILGRPDEVDDLVQDVFLSAHKHIADLREPAALKGWLASITVRAAQRRLKKRRLYSFFGFSADEPDYGQVADDQTSLEDKALISAVFVALDALPAADRVAWSLRHLESETMERVAELCECSVSTAKRRVQAAHDALVKKGVLRE